MSLAVRHGPSHDQSRPSASRRITLGGNFLIRGGEGQGLGDEVLLAGAQAESVSTSSTAEKLVEPVRERVSGVGAWARHGCLRK